MLLLAWKLLTSNEQWAQLCRSGFLHQGQPKTHHITYSIWIGMKPMIKIVYHHSIWTIGTGTDVNFWTDNWLDKPIVKHWHLPEYACNALVFI